MVSSQKDKSVAQQTIGKTFRRSKMANLSQCWRILLPHSINPGSAFKAFFQRRTSRRSRIWVFIVWAIFSSTQSYQLIYRCIEYVTYPISISVQIDELFLGDKLVMRKTRLRVKHVRKRLVCYQCGHPDEQEVKEYISGKETLSSMLISSHSWFNYFLVNLKFPFRYLFFPSHFFHSFRTGFAEILSAADPHCVHIWMSKSSTFNMFIFCFAIVSIFSMTILLFFQHFPSYAPHHL